MLTVEALRSVYTALGGESSAVAGLTTIPEIIAKIAEAIPTATAAELPKVTTSNNDQVLTVDGGKWKAKALPGG